MPEICYGIMTAIVSTLISLEAMIFMIYLMQRRNIQFFFNDKYVVLLHGM